MKQITKAVVPAAGIGSRLLPLTKSVPKELLPVGGKPVIQRTVEELVASGIHEITIVVSPGKEAVVKHFCEDAHLVEQLYLAGKYELAALVEAVSKLAAITFITQTGPYGNGTPVLNAAPGNEPFVVLWPDDVFVPEIGAPTRTTQLLEAHYTTGSPVMAVQGRDDSFPNHYTRGYLRSDGFVNVESVGYRKPDNDPARLFPSIGGYVVTPEVVGVLDKMTRNFSGRPGEEIALPEAFSRLAEGGGNVVGCITRGRFLDTGTLESYAEAVRYFLHLAA